MATITAPPPPSPPTWPTPNQQPNPTTSWPPPALFMKMEFGISLAPTSAHNVSLSYASRPITTSRLAKTIPTFLLPASARRGRASKQDSRPSPRSRSEILMRPSTITPAHQQYTAPQPSYPHPERPSHPQRTSSLTPNYAPPLRWGPTRHFLEHKPLPELPSRFRLGEPDLPWSSPAPSIRSTTTVQTTSTPAAGPPSDPVWSAVSPPSTTWAAPRSISNPSSPIVSPEISAASPHHLHHHHSGSVSSPASPADANTLPKPWRDTSFYTSIPGPRSITPPQNQRARAVSASDQGASRGSVSEGGERSSVRDYEAEMRARDERRTAIDPLREREMHSLQAAMMSFDALGEWDETTASMGMNAAPGPGVGYPHHTYMDQWNSGARGAKTVGWAVGVGEDGRRGVVRDDEAGWQRYNFEEWDRAGKGWSYRDVNGFTSYWPDGMRRRSWNGGETPDWAAMR
ncbi:hypothetical protein V498_00150 [Pseudogymnoascus sp. VKM F-4517 (FW-2822)]|nr:hypothetical protein V498_00150 [Pseudogymnoascus sp. VKM F-4517 (FW-2822)]